MLLEPARDPRRHGEGEALQWAPDRAPEVESHGSASLLGILVQLHQDVASFDLYGEACFVAPGRRTEYRARRHVEFGAVPRAGDDLASQGSLSQRASDVGARSINGVERTADVEQGYRLTFDLHRLALSR